jgi:tRNA(Ile)-lysidine synthase TilS/MesJ
MKICTKCVLPASFPGVSFNEESLCNHCQKFNGKQERLPDEKKKYKQKFLELLNQVIKKKRTQAVRGAKRSYDVLMSYSGGKDSTYTLCLFRNKYKLRVLAVTVDNNFLSETAVRNIKTVTDELGTDHLLFKPGWRHLKKIFAAATERELYAKKALERASTVCTSCMGIVKSFCLKTAIEMDIPLIGYGWSPGQAPLESAIMKNNPAFIRTTQQAIMKPLREIAGNEIEAYFLNETHYANADRLPYNVHPLAWELYSESAIVEEIKKIGWVPPQDTDSNSTNCVLNAFANDVHIRRYGFHPYVWEIANMVREGVMTREEGYKKIYEEQNASFIENARDKLFK